MRFRKTIRGRNCSLIRFEIGDDNLVNLIFKLFNEKEIAEYLNPAYIKNKTKYKIRKWISEKVNNPVEVWYVINWKRHSVGYVCFKWRKHYDEACEISTAIAFEYRGLKLGYESSKLLIKYVLSLKKFKYIVGYVYKTNYKAANNLKKIGFRMANRLQKIITKQFYGESGSGTGKRRYNLLAINGRLK